MKSTIKYNSKELTVYYFVNGNDVIIDQIYVGAEIIYDLTSNFNSHNINIGIVKSKLNK